MIARNDTEVYHEPHGEVFYFGSEAGSTRYANAPRCKATYASIAARIRNMVRESPKPYVFVKDISYFIENRISEETVPASTKHTFLLRHPAAAVRSMWSKSCVDNARTKWTYFDPNEAGFKQLYDIFRYVRDTLKQDLIIVDADDLLENPAGILAEYCARLGIPFSTDQLNWTPGPPKEWGPIETREPGWHDDAIASSGFTTQKSHFDPKSVSLDQLPIDVQKAISDSLAYYNEMYDLRIRAQEL